MPDLVPDAPGFGATNAPEDAYTNTGKPAEHDWGVQYQGSFEGAADGTARAVRLHARALAGANIPVLLQSFTGHFRGPEGVLVGAQAIDRKIKEEVGALQHTSIRELRLRIKHAVIPHAQVLRRWIVPQSLQADDDPVRAFQAVEGIFRSTIVYSVWERTTIDPKIAVLLRRVAECWVPCWMNLALLRKHGVERVCVVPHPYDPESPVAALAERRARAERRFYSIGLWQPRKGFHELVGAFLRSTRPGSQNHLTIKYQETRFRGYPSPRESIEYWLVDGAVRRSGWCAENLTGHLKLLSGHWPEEKITELHADSNIYVSASHGEAFCLPAFDAKLAGNALVHVPWGGTEDFSDPRVDEPVKFVMGPVPPGYGWETGAEWAEYRVDDLAAALERARVPERHERPLGFGKYSLENVGKLMRERVEGVLGG